MGSDFNATRRKKRQQNTSIKNLFYLRFVVLFCCLYVAQESRNLMSSCSFVARKNCRKLYYQRG
jgi:hypothetical protein